MGSFPGLVPGSNVGGWGISVPYQAQQGGQASLGGNINPLLPINTSTNSSFPMMPQGAVSGSATSGFPAPVTTSGFSANMGTTAPLPTNTGGFPANTGGFPQPVIPGGAPGVVAPPNNPTAGQAGITGIAQNLGFPSTQQGQHKLWDSLKNTYGSGLATIMMNYLASGAGFNQGAINNLIAGLQPGFERQSQNLLQQFSAGGNRFGSGAQIGLGDLASQQQLQVGELETQMYEQAVQNYMNVLMDISAPTAKRVASTPSLFDQIAGGIGAAASIIGAPFTGGLSLAGLGPSLGVAGGGGGGFGGGGIGDYGGGGGGGVGTGY